MMSVSVCQTSPDRNGHHCSNVAQHSNSNRIVSSHDEHQSARQLRPCRVAWTADKPIDKCLGFALYRHRTDGAAVQTVDTFVGPSTEKKIPAGTKQPSTVWPIQKFTWADYLLEDQAEFVYQVAAMCGPDFDHMKPGEKSDWSNPVCLEMPDDALIQPYFNRGLSPRSGWPSSCRKKSSRSRGSSIPPTARRTRRAIFSAAC